MCTVMQLCMYLYLWDYEGSATGVMGALIRWTDHNALMMADQGCLIGETDSVPQPWLEPQSLYSATISLLSEARIRSPDCLSGAHLFLKLMDGQESDARIVIMVRIAFKFLTFLWLLIPLPHNSPPSHKSWQTRQIWTCTLVDQQSKRLVSIGRTSPLRGGEIDWLKGNIAKVRLPRPPHRDQISLVDLDFEIGKRRAAPPGPEELDRKIKPPSPRPFLQGCGTKTDLLSIVQPHMPVMSVS